MLVHDEAKVEIPHLDSAIFAHEIKQKFCTKVWLCAQIVGHIATVDPFAQRKAPAAKLQRARSWRRIGSDPRLPSLSFAIPIGFCPLECGSDNVTGRRSRRVVMAGAMAESRPGFW